MLRFIISCSFEKFRKNNLRNYGLWASHYLSAPDLSWDAMLKMTNDEPEIIPYSHICILFEKGTRGGISYIFLIDIAKYTINV